MKLMENWFLNGERNVHRFKLVNDDGRDISLFEKMIVSIDDTFVFEILTDKKTISCDEEFLERWVESVNSKSHDSIIEFLQSASDEYGKLMDDALEKDDKILIYSENNVDNDLNDIKFVDRIRFKQEDFNSDLFSIVFEFLNAKDVCRLARVCKDWNRLSNDESIWKRLCLIDHKCTNNLNDSWRYQYIEKSFVWNWQSSRNYEIDGKTIRFPNQWSVWIPAKTTRGCMPGQRKVFKILVGKCRFVGTYITIGIVDGSVDLDRGFDEHPSGVKGHHTMGVWGWHGYVPSCIMPHDRIWTIIIDRTNLSEPFIEMNGIDPEMMKGAKVDQDSTWFPSISCVYAQEFIIIPN